VPPAPGIALKLRLPAAASKMETLTHFAEASMSERANSKAPASTAATADQWTAVRPERAGHLSDARLQLHYAAQFAAAAGIAFLPHRADDSHTNLEWSAELGALLSRRIASPASFRIGVRAADLSVLIIEGASEPRASFALNGRTIAEGASWIATQLAALGVDASRYSLAHQYELPPHAVARGAPFNTGDALAFTELSSWIGNGATVLSALVAATAEASELRCWPHHFDIASLLHLGDGRTIGVGLEPGDGYYDEPYFYVNLGPPPSADALTVKLAGGGSWHTRDWIGAVLPGSRLATGAAEQQRQVREFLDSAVAACRAMLASASAR
jgi:hypothetical protein